MSSVRLASAVFLLSTALSHASLAGIRPSFMLDHASWQSTNIVSVLSMRQGGVFTVVESWKGDLRPGSLVTVPGLAPSPAAVPIEAYPTDIESFINGSGPSVQIPRQPEGSRMVLFLTRDVSKGPEAWRPSNLFKDFKTSAIWIHGGHLYAFQQMFNPGPSMLTTLRISETSLRDRVAEIERVQRDFDEIESEIAEVRARRLKSYVLSDILPARQFALKELGMIGPAATATIREMLDDRAFAEREDELIAAYVSDGGEAVSEDLNLRLRDQLSFWRATAFALPIGWWNLMEAPRTTEALRSKYVLTLELVKALQLVQSAEALSTAKELSSFWKSLPQLNDPSGLNRMTEECDKLIELSLEKRPEM